MLYVNKNDLDTLYTEEQMKSRMVKEGISPPGELTNRTLDILGWATVPEEPFTPNVGFKYSAKAELQDDGSYKRVYSEVPLTQAEIDSVATKVRTKRDYLLRTKVDSLNVIRFSELTAEQQKAWVDYRKALLNISDQPTFPFNVEWPEAPSV